MGILEDLSKRKKIKAQKEKEQKEFVRLLKIRFTEMFPDKPKGQDKIIINDAFKYGNVIHDKSLPITDKVFLITISFLRHQFYFKLHYGFRDKRREANRQALNVMKEWGYNPDKYKIKVLCPKCLGNKCSLCYTGKVPKWVAFNYERQIIFQQADGDKAKYYEAIG